MLTRTSTAKLLQQAGSDELACIEILQAYTYAKIARGNSRTSLTKKLARVHDRVYRSPSDAAFRSAYRTLSSSLAGARSSWGGKSVVGSLSRLRRPATTLGAAAWVAACGGRKKYERACARLGALDDAGANSDEEDEEDEPERPASRPAPLFAGVREDEHAANWKPQPPRPRREVQWQRSWDPEATRPADYAIARGYAPLRYAGLPAGHARAPNAGGNGYGHARSGSAAAAYPAQAQHTRAASASTGRLYMHKRNDSELSYGRAEGFPGEYI